MITLDHDSIMRLVAPADLVRPIRAAFQHPPIAPDRSHFSIARGQELPGTLMVMPAWREGDFIGVQIGSVFPANAERGLPTVMGQYLLLSAETGEAVALFDGRALTLLRASAVSALAADILAPKTARRLLMVGAGALAPFLIEAHACVRDYETIQLWARDRAKAQALADALEPMSITVEVVADLEKAARKADVISCATMSDRPLISGAWLGDGCHLDLVGGFRPDMREADDRAFEAAMVVTDTRRAMAECGDLCEPLTCGVLEPSAVLTLEDICKAGFERRAASQRSVFKSIGAACADLAAAEHVLHRAVAGRARRGQANLLPQFAH